MGDTLTLLHHRTIWPSRMPVKYDILMVGALDDLD